MTSLGDVCAISARTLLAAVKWCKVPSDVAMVSVANALNEQHSSSVVVGHEEHCPRVGVSASGSTLPFLHAMHKCVDDRLETATTFACRTVMLGRLIDCDSGLTC